jgi:drug/metabolite transporter (DMT)-like permease
MIRVSNRELDPFWGAGMRFAIAAALFSAWMFAARIPFPRGQALIGAMLYGVVGIGVYFAFVYRGLVDVQVGYGQVLLSLAPLLTLFLALAQGLERYRWTGLAAVCAAEGSIILKRFPLGLRPRPRRRLRRRGQHHPQALPVGEHRRHKRRLDDDRLDHAPRPVPRLR